MHFKRFLLAGAILLSLPMPAQEKKPFRIGVEAGASIHNYTGTDRYYKDGFYAGVRGEYSLKNCYVTGGLRFIQKGADAYTGDSDSDDFYRANYIEIPLAVGIQHRINKSLYLFGETGPYVAVGISGKSKGESYSGGPGNTTHWDDKFFSAANDSPRRLDVGWGLRAGLGFYSFQISIGYEIGFIPVWSVSDSQLANYNNHNSGFTAGIAYLF